MVTCMPSSSNFSYMMLNLVGEVGEFSSKVAKLIRKGKAHIGNETYPSDSHLYIQLGDLDMKEYAEIKTELKKEAGDILWQLAGLCRMMGWDLEGVAQMNLDKLSSRQERGVIDGSGDNR